MNMLTSLKETGKSIGTELNHAWESLAEGWRELLSRSSAALTHFSRGEDEKPSEVGAPNIVPRWGLLAGEMEETDRDVLVRIELPGLDKEDCLITLEGNMLHVRGEKRFESETSNSTYHVMERAYGFFQRSIALPRHVNLEKAEASFKNGVLTVRLPKEGTKNTRRIVVS